MYRRSIKRIGMSQQIGRPARCTNCNLTKKSIDMKSKQNTRSQKGQTVKIEILRSAFYVFELENRETLMQITHIVCSGQRSRRKR